MTRVILINLLLCLNSHPQVVVANLLETRRSEVILVSHGNQDLMTKNLTIASSECIELEEIIVSEIVQKHKLFTR